MKRGPTFFAVNSISVTPEANYTFESSGISPLGLATAFDVILYV